MGASAHGFRITGKMPVLRQMVGWGLPHRCREDMKRNVKI
jgi:hypothetical protein